MNLGAETLDCCFAHSLIGSGWLDLGLKEGQIGSKCDKSTTFSDQITLHFGSQSDLKKVPYLFHLKPIWLTFDPSLKNLDWLHELVEPRKSCSGVSDLAQRDSDWHKKWHILHLLTISRIASGAGGTTVVMGLSCMSILSLKYPFPMWPNSFCW